MSAMNVSQPVLLYDGICGFCNQSIQFILRHDKKGTMLFAALQSDYAKAVLAEHPELAGIDSLVLIERRSDTDEPRISIRSGAALRVARYLAGTWKLALLGYVVPRALRDFFYDQFAKRRYRWFGKHDTCMLPPPEVRSRFLDVESTVSVGNPLRADNVN